MNARHTSSPPTVAVVNCGVGNLLSVRGALARLGADAFEAERPRDLERAQAVVLPGVGAFPAAMDSLLRGGFASALSEHVRDRGKPFLGICLGMQLLAESSVEFGWTRGLGWLAGRVTLMPDQGIRLPHVGWNTVEQRDPVMFARIAEDAHFYFDHSYRLECDPQARAGMCRHGQPFVAAVRRANLWGVQFHPEKSQLNGLRLLRNFLDTIPEGSPC